ncbi:MAG TPA: lasso peptide biosynthesis B2 protein [Vicinamibacterales bacterium]|nr:lasso peptide biosynthesis B2 protein [Vicinamibacterales bacterium]
MRVGPGDSFLVLAAAGALAASRVLLRWAPGWTVRLAAAPGRPDMSRRPSAAGSTSGLVRAVERAGRRCPWRTTCLERAVALVLLLVIHRRAGRLAIGVARSGGALRAHAWVEADGSVILGGGAAAADVASLWPLTAPCNVD